MTMRTREAALAGCLLAATLAACATPRAEAPTRLPDPVAVPAPADTAPDLPDAPALPEMVLIPGPAAESFVGQPVADIETLIGAPALVRREGNAEFRRYDVRDDCRAYVVALPGGGTILSVETGGAVQGAPAPAFEDCTAREDFAGS